jgi:hypothetical protein
MPAVPFPTIPLEFLPAPYAAPGRRPFRNEPMRLKTLVINKIAHKAEKRTQASYHPWYQSLRAILAPFLKKYEWNDERSCDVL